MKFNQSGISVFLAVWLGVVMSLSPSLMAQSQVVPRGTTLKLILNDNLSTKETNVGDKFHATVAEDVTADGRVMIQHGATVQGTVTEVEQAKRLAGLRGKAKMMLRFDSVVTVNGSRPLVATVVSVHDPVPGNKGSDISEEGEVRAGSDVRGTITRGAIGVAAGAVLGALFGNVSRGLMLGTIGGAVAILAPKAKDVKLKEGTGIQIRLDRDLNISAT
jgi:hypothetical protein